MGNATVISSPRPFIKWAGGKGQLLSQIDKFLPIRLFNEDFTYIEPFVGGGAMLFHVIQKYPHLTRVVINDINENLIKAYSVIKEKPSLLIDVLKEMETDYLATSTEEERKEKYLDLRDKFNLHNLDDINNAAYLIFLNKTCFNGLYRVNSKGDFNVPFGRYKNPQICNEAVIVADSKALNQIQVIIKSGDYSQTTEFIDNGGLTFFYFDPPYRPLSATSSFTAYAKGNFSDEDQEKLADFCKRIDSDNCLWMLSNSDCSAKNPEDKFFERIYSQFCINRVSASRSINANPTKRGRLTELLIHNDYAKTSNELFKAI